MTALLPTPRDDTCLGFINTLSWRGTEMPTEELRTPDDLLRWLATEGGADAALVERCRAEWAAEASAAAALAEALALRESLHTLCAAATAHQACAEPDLDRVNAALLATPRRTALHPCAAGYRWRIPDSGATLPILLAPVLWSAAALLSGPRLDRLRACENDRCRWLFLDESKAGNRRWCSMSACGNRAKAHRHYLKRTLRTP